MPRANTPNNQITTDDEFIKLWRELKSPKKVRDAIGCDLTAVYRRRRSLEARYGLDLNADQDKPLIERHSARINVPIENGIAIVFSDAHFWDNNPSTAYRALIKFIKDLKPAAIIANGDVFDGASISRHGRIGFLEHRPSVIDELNACKAMMDGIEAAAKEVKPSPFLTWTLGNHDSRFETYLAAVAPEYEFVNGFHLKDHFPAWRPCWATWINDVCIKHRWKGGVHATHNNTLGSGVSMVTGHLHSLKVSGYTDYTGTRYGVDTGTLAEIDGDQFLNYTEDNPKNWRSGFAVLSFWKGKLLPPELVEVIGDGIVAFRGKAYEI
jgi:hypothetical protein